MRSIRARVYSNFCSSRTDIRDAGKQVVPPVDPYAQNTEYPRVSVMESQ